MARSLGCGGSGVNALVLLRKVTTGVLVVMLCTGCSKSVREDAGAAVAITGVAAVVIAAQVSGVAPLIRAAKTPTPLERLSAASCFSANPQAQALAAAAEKGDIKEIDRLVDAGADVNAVGMYGLTIAEWLLFHPNEDGFRRLLERGADANMLTVWSGEDVAYRDFQQQQSSLVHWAAYRTKALGPEYLRLVLDVGKGDPNLEPPDRQSRPILKALEVGNEAAFFLLLNKGAELEFFNARRESPIGAAASPPYRNYRLVYFMLLRGAHFYHSQGRLKSSLLYEVNRGLRYESIAREPFGVEYMWFWRCVDYLEKNAVRLDYESNDKGAALRPAVIDTVVDDLLSPVRDQFVRARGVCVYGVTFRLSRPYWDRVSSLDEKYHCLSKKDEFGYHYIYYGKGELTNPVAQHLIVRPAHGMSFEQLSASVLSEYREGLRMETVLVEKGKDNGIYQIKKASRRDIGGYMYIGLCNDTLVIIWQMIQKTDAEADAANAAYVLQGMRQVNLSPKG
jgi:hypothetical protein